VHVAAELIKAEGVEKTLEVVITSGLVKQKAFLQALEERLAPPLAKVGQSGVLDGFRAQFHNANFRKGLRLSFTTKGGRVTTKIDGAEVGMCLFLPFFLGFK
jgi:hypothetical protein